MESKKTTEKKFGQSPYDIPRMNDYPVGLG